MTARTREAFRWEKFVFVVFAPFSLGLLCLWGFAVEIRDQKDANVLRLTVDASADARRYIVQHLVDSVGWLALAESALIAESNKPPSFAATQAIAIAAVLAPVDGQVLRGQALSAIRAGEIAAGLSHAATMAVLFPAESRNAFAILRAYGNHPVWPGFFQNQLDSRWPAAESFLLDSCQVGAPLQTLIAMAQPVIRRQSLSENMLAIPWTT